MKKDFNDYDSSDWYYHLKPKKDSRECYMVEILTILLNYYYREYQKLRRYIDDVK